MMLYVNGDSHTAAAEAVNSYAFAEDDPELYHLGRLPHPDNAEVSWATVLSKKLTCELKLDAESASSNARIRRTTWDWLMKQPITVLKNLFVIIQWSTWEREEWAIDGDYYQINASGIDIVPSSHEKKYQEFVVNVNWDQVQKQEHDAIWKFHQALDYLSVKHIFFNGNSYFDRINKSDQYDWGTSFMGPYDQQDTYDLWLKSNGFKTVNPKSWHFGKDAHCAWADHVLQYIVFYKLKN